MVAKLDKTPKPAVMESPMAPITEISDGRSLWTLVGVPSDISRGGQLKAEPEVLVWASRAGLLYNTNTTMSERVSTAVENIILVEAVQQSTLFD